MAKTAERTSTDFNITETARGLGPNLPQRIGRRLWLPMLLMAAMAFPAAIVLGAIRASLLADGEDPTLVAALGFFTPAATFFGFMSAFSAISFAIARILSEFRVGGGQVQEAAGRAVRTLKMPLTAKVFIAGMAMAMMILLAAVVLYAIVGFALLGGSASAAAHAGQWQDWIDAGRRVGIALYLVSISFGLATIITVLRFQSIRGRELPDEPPAGTARTAV